MSAALQERPAARILHVTEDEYYADPCDVPSLSQSVAHTLITQSPLHAWTQHPRLNPVPRVDEPTTAVSEGSIIHALLLGQGGDIEIVQAKDYKTKVAQEQRDAAFAAGRIPVIESRFDDIKAAAEILRKNIAGYGVELGPETEFAIEWLERGNYGPVVCRGKPDNLHRGFVMRDPDVPPGTKHTLFDLKKISSADPETCSRHAYDYGYDIQRAAYVSATSKLLDVRPEEVDFVFLFMELDAPYTVHPLRLTETYMVMGERRWSRAVNLWEHCLRNARWPTYTSTIARLDAPGWAITKEDKFNGSF